MRSWRRTVDRRISLLDALIPFLEKMAGFGLIWGPLLVLLFMTVESSFIPFPSEIVMIPAGFMAARGEFFPADHAWGALGLAVACGIAGSLLGAWINYVLALKLGRPFLHRWGKYFFLAPDKLDRAERIFREYGEITTFVCRLIPVVRQLISIPAGISRMHFGRFSFFTGAGAGIWVILLTSLGYWFGTTTEGLSYAQLVHQAKAMLNRHFIWIFLGCALLVGIYVWVHTLVAGRDSSDRKGLAQK
jgi:membrane protein DedA with SNARE-associated domain